MPLRFLHGPTTAFEDVTRNFEQLEQIDPLQAANNLADVASNATAIDNLGALDAMENLAELADKSAAITNLGFGAFSAHQTGPASVTGNTWTKVQFATSDFDTTGWLDAVTNYRFTPLTAGYWVISAAVGVATVSAATLNSGGNLVALYKNGSLYSYLGAGSDENHAVLPGLVLGGAIPVQFNGSTDYAEVWTYVNTGGATGLNNSGYFTGWRVA